MKNKISKNKKNSHIAKAKAESVKKEKAGRPIKDRSNIYSSYSFIILIILLGIFIFFCGNVWHIQDDTFISLRYVKNFVNGYGLVFNPNERVEGYTNFLWVVILITATFLKFDPITSSQYLSVFFGIVSILAIYRILLIVSKRFPPISYDSKLIMFIGLLPAFLTVFTGAFVYWAVSGMESTLFTSLILGAIYYYFKNDSVSVVPPPRKLNYVTSILLALASLTRPEGLLFAILLFFHKILFHTIQNKKLFINKQLLIELSVFMLPVTLHYLLRYYYYGYLLPNTFYAKANFDLSSFKSGINYLYSFLTEYLFYGLATIIMLFVLRNKKIFYEVTLLFFIVVIYILYVIFIGGDVLALHRFWIPVMPLIYILFTLGLIEVINLIIPRHFIFVFIVIIVLGCYNFLSMRDDIMKITEKEIALVEMMRFRSETVSKLEKIKNRKLTVATSTIGALSYYTNAIIVDILGLADSYVAHHPQFIEHISNDSTNPWKEKRYNADYILSRKPDYILFSTDIKPSAFGERALFSTNQFFHDYFFQFIPVSYGNLLYFYTRKNDKQLRVTNPAVLTENINPGFASQYVNLLQAFNSFRVSRNNETINSFIAEFDRLETLKPSFFADGYRLYGDVMSMQGNFSFARNFITKQLQQIHSAFYPTSAYPILTITKQKGRSSVNISMQWKTFH